MRALCEALVVSRSGFYAWRNRGQIASELDLAVASEFNRQQSRAGATSMACQIREDGFAVSTRTIGRSLKKQGLSVRYKRKFRHTTDSKHKLPVARNLLDRQFKVEHPNRVWVGDITYLRSSEGWLYLAVMIDLFNRQVVGWQMSERIDQRLVNDALEAALTSRGKPQNVLVHTDRGSQYCAYSFVEIISENKLQQSMSRKGNCWESEHCSDAVAESFFASLKKQAIYGHKLESRQDLRSCVFEYIEHYYNRVRRHSANGWITPVEYQRLHNQRSEVVTD